MNIIKDYLTVNRYSRPGKKLKSVKGIVIHWVQNPMTSAKFTRNWFEILKGGKYSFGSTQYVVGLKGEIIQMMPEDEMSYNCGARKYREGIKEKLGKYPNGTTIGIECCHTNWDGEMTTETYKSLTILSL